MKPSLNTIKVGQKVKIPLYQYYGFTAYRTADLIGTIIKINECDFTVTIEDGNWLKTINVQASEMRLA
jgi:ribosomal protein L21E